MELNPFADVYISQIHLTRKAPYQELAEADRGITPKYTDVPLEIPHVQHRPERTTDLGYDSQEGSLTVMPKLGMVRGHCVQAVKSYELRKQ
jgi:hypothetical protein